MDPGGIYRDGPWSRVPGGRDSVIQNLFQFMPVQALTAGGL